MMHKLIVMISIFLFTISAVNAIDVNDTLNADQSVLTLNNEICDDNLQIIEENNTLTQTNEMDVSTYSELAFEIGSGGDILLDHDYYTYDSGHTIIISTDNSYIYGNGAVIDMAGSNIRAFYVSGYDVTIKNLVIKNANFDGEDGGGAITFRGSGTVENCTFIDNSAPSIGAICFEGLGNVTNCNFINNKATDEETTSGAIYLHVGTIKNSNFTHNSANRGGAVTLGSGSVENCNFADNSVSGYGGALYMFRGTIKNCTFVKNSASEKGGAIWLHSVNVINCNFTNNTASEDAGAIHFFGNGNVTNCNFADNSAPQGGAILSERRGVTTDTCIFKTDSDTTSNIHILPPILNVDNFTSVYGSKDKLTFDLRTNSNIPVDNGNISISVYFKDNNICFGNYTCLSDEGWIPDLPVASYYAIFDTEYAEFQPIKRTITITMPKIQYYINVTSITTNNKTVNITAKTNIPKDILWEPKLIFILPNGNKIDANYLSGGIWWALLSFDDYGEYDVGASYVGLDNANINNGTITITNGDSTLILDDIVLEYGESKNITVKTEVAIGITAKIDENDVDVNNFSIMFPTLAAGNYTLTATTIPDDGYNSVAKTVILTVKKTKPDITVENTTVTMNVSDSVNINATLNPKDAGNLTFTSSNTDVAEVNNGKITANRNGTAIITVSFEGNENYTVAESKTITVTVKKIDTFIEVENKSLELKVEDESQIEAILTPAEAGKLKFTSSDESIINVDDNGNIKAISEGSAVITVSFGGNNKYEASKDKTIAVTVNLKDASVITEPDSLKLSVGESGEFYVETTPEDLDIVVSSSNESVATVKLVNRVPTVTAVGEGSATITLTYKGDNKYAPSNATVSVKVSKSEIKPEIEQNDTTLTVSVPEDATGDVTVTIGNETITAPIKDGKAVIDLSDVPAGDYNATVSYPGDNKYSGFEVVSPVSIESEFQLIAENLTKYYHGPERFAVKALDGKGNPISGAEVKISLNGMTYTRITDENGSASIGVNLESGVFITTVTYNNTTVEATITVLTTVNGTDLVKVFRNATQYYATFRDSEGNYLKEGTNVRFNIHGVFYDYQISGDKGLAKLNINLEQGEYIITAINMVTGESRANYITVLPRIVENYDLTKYYRNDSQYAVKLIGDDGNPVGAGENVTFNINGVFYTRTTNESGIAKLNINLQEGDYIITAGYKGCMVSNNIKVLPVLTAKDLTKKYGTKDQFVANLVDGQGKAYAGQSVQFNINGVFYNRITDSNGQAKLNINLQPGEYIITSSYNGASIGNKVTVTA